ncbi:hypothetical protein P879_03459 [Paragonimus westermani]|uniref:Peptidase A1 domain-containing protein n=1 Tax=Paragonimus westermani TaxID=34504 RepID=A0A8T0DM34_9TREM|nr:hypothetical protein P879_03459 [Paragonimus westermani]
MHLLSLPAVVQILALCHVRVVVTQIQLPVYAHVSENTVLEAESNESGFLSKISGLSGRAYYIPINLGTPAQQASCTHFYCVKLSLIKGRKIATYPAVEICIHFDVENLNLLLDTGSSDTGVASKSVQHVNRWFDPSASSTLLCSDLIQRVQYHVGSWKGYLCSDQLSFPNARGIANQTNIQTSLEIEFAIIDEAHDFFLPNNASGWEGIAGLGFPALSVPPMKPSASNSKTATSRLSYLALNLFPTASKPLGLFDSLVQQWGLTDVFSLLLCGLTPKNVSRARL